MASPTPKASSMFEPEVVAELRRQFDEADTGGTGQLNASEACKVFARNSLPDADEEEVRRMADNLRNHIDRDKSGTISFDEYCFRFGRKYQMELKKRRFYADESPTPGVDANNNHDSSDITAELRREREAAAQEREALAREREALRREREELNRSRSSEEPASSQRNGDPSLALSQGARVRVQGLQGAPELNGALATVIRFETSNSRYVVQLDGGGGQKSLKRDNLTTASTGTSGRQGTGASGTAGTGTSLLGKVKDAFSSFVANVTVWLAGYEWWQIALGIGVVVVVVGAWLQQSARYSNPALNSNYRRASDYTAENAANERENPYGGRRHAQRQPDYGHYDDHDYGSGQYNDYGSGQYNDYGSGYDAGGQNYYSSGGGGGMFGDNGQLYTLLIVGGLAYACWKGIIPVHRMSWFELMMLWNMISPLIMGGRGGGYGGGYRRRRGFF